MTSPYNPDPTPLDLIDVGRLAQEYLEEIYGEAVVRKQLASGVAVHFGGMALFVPGENHVILSTRVQKHIEELACAYVAWQYAVEQAQKEESNE